MSTNSYSSACRTCFIGILKEINMVKDPDKYLNSLSIWRVFTCVCVCVCPRRESKSLDSSLTKTNHSEGLVGHVAQITALSVGTRPACVAKTSPSPPLLLQDPDMMPSSPLPPFINSLLFILLTPISSEIWNLASSLLPQSPLSVNPPLHLVL